MMAALVRRGLVHIWGTALASAALWALIILAIWGTT